MGSINYGNQQISIEYNERLRAAEANELLYGVLRPGIISWNTIGGNPSNLEYINSNIPVVENGSNFNGNEIVIRPFTALLPTVGAFGEKMLIKVKTTEDIRLDGTGILTPFQNSLVQNFVYIKYDWSESTGNYADVSIISGNGSSGLLPFNAVVIASYYTDKYGKFVLFTGFSLGGISSQVPQNQYSAQLSGPVIIENGDYSDILALKVIGGTNVSTQVEINPVPPSSVYFGNVASYKQLRIDSLDEKVKVSANDTTPGSLTDKITSDSNFTWNILNPGGNEQLQITFAGSLQFDKIKITGADTVNEYLYDSIEVDSNLSKTIQNPGANEKLLISNLKPGHRITSPISGVMPQRWSMALLGYGFSLADNGLGDATEITFGARTQSHAPVITTLSLDLEAYEVHYVDLTSVPSAISITLNGVFSANGKTVLIKFLQGPLPIGITFTNTIKWRGGTPVFTVAPNAIDMVSIISDGVDLYGVAALNFI